MSTHKVTNINIKATTTNITTQLQNLILSVYFEIHAQQDQMKQNWITVVSCVIWRGNSLEQAFKKLTQHDWRKGFFEFSFFQEW